jgi:hypothetical protein
MDMQVKLLLTFLIVGMMLMFVAAVLEGCGYRDAANCFGYTGLSLIGVDVMLLAVMALRIVWSKG